MRWKDLSIPVIARDLLSVANASGSLKSEGRDQTINTTVADNVMMAE